MIALLNFDRITGAIVGFLIAWAILAGLNQFVWLPAARNEGREAERVAALKKAVELIQERGRTNDKVRNLDRDGLCIALGGRVSNGVCE